MILEKPLLIKKHRLSPLKENFYIHLRAELVLVTLNKSISLTQYCQPWFTTVYQTLWFRATLGTEITIVSLRALPAFSTTDFPYQYTMTFFVQPCPLDSIN